MNSGLFEGGNQDEQNGAGLVEMSEICVMQDGFSLEWPYSIEFYQHSLVGPWTSVSRVQAIFDRPPPVSVDHSFQKVGESVMYTVQPVLSGHPWDKIIMSV